ncbi:MAG: prephenate dehydrogenase/arogenate dehydrogenase family protein [Candidatus Omnitrophica bacterium]|nr:prephenate dehydrogenase/arogenate dehydrogenase family protein [Candidatus Omnitrophota bacterium]
MKDKRKKTFAVVGLGLMGGSLGLALKKRFKGCTVIGISRSQAKVREAKRRRMISWGTTDIGRGVKDTDFVFVCTPVGSIPKYVEKIDRSAKPGCIVTDVGSTKETLMKWASHKKFRAIRFIGSHPMAGSHETGLRYVKGDLYDNSLVFITP